MRESRGSKRVRRQPVATWETLHLQRVAPKKRSEVLCCRAISRLWQARRYTRRCLRPQLCIQRPWHLRHPMCQKHNYIRRCLTVFLSTATPCCKPRTATLSACGRNSRRSISHGCCRQSLQRRSPQSRETSSLSALKQACCGMRSWRTPLAVRIPRHSRVPLSSASHTGSRSSVMKLLAWMRRADAFSKLIRAREILKPPCVPALMRPCRQRTPIIKCSGSEPPIWRPACSPV